MPKPLDAGADRDETEKRLFALPAIGPWTAAYVAMRALSDLEVFPATDLGVPHALELLGEDGRPPAAERLAERWRPYSAYPCSTSGLATCPRATRTATGNRAPDQFAA